jgi:hypothetical protein
MPKTRKISAGQIKLIRILKHRLNIDEDMYRAALKNSAGVTSAIELTYYQANEIIQQWKKIAVEEGKWFDNESNSRHASLSNRGAGYATVAQLDAIDKAWKEVTMHTNPEAANLALDKMCKRICKRAGMANLLRTDVEKMLLTIRTMPKNQGGNNA